jgi:hypothetical protein
MSNPYAFIGLPLGSQASGMCFQVKFNVVLNNFPNERWECILLITRI